MLNKPFRTLFCLFIFGILFSLKPAESLAQTEGPQSLEAGAAPAAPEATVQVSLVNQIGGATYPVALRGSYAYIGVGPRLAVVDISDPTKPVVAGMTAVMPGLVQDIFVPTSGSFAYVANDVGGLFIVNITNPSQPAVAGSFNTSGSANGVAVSGSYAYVADGSAGLRVINVSNPASPSEVGFLDTTGTSMDAAYLSSRVYLADGDALRIIDVSTPSKPALLGTYLLPTGSPYPYAYGVAVAGSYAYLAAGTIGLQIIQVSNPSSPTKVGEYGTSDANGVALYNNLAFVADYASGLYVVNVTTPAAPTLYSSVSVPGHAYNVATMAGNYAFVAADMMGLRVIDYVPPTAEAGKYDPATVTTAVDVSGGYAFLAAGYDGAQIVDVNNPQVQSEVSTYDTPGFVYGVDLAGIYAYLADNYGGLIIINKSTPAAPAFVGSLDTPGNAMDVAVSGSYAYVADYGSGLRILNVSNPASPSETGSLDTAGYAVGVEVSGSYAYVADSANGLRVIYKETPASPAEVGYYDTAQNAMDVAISGKLAYVADGSDGLRIINLPTYYVGSMEKEDNDTIATANGQIHSGQVYQGYHDDTNDYFSFTTNASGSIAVSLSVPVGPVVQLILYKGSTQVASDTTAPFSLSYSGAADTYAVRVYTSSGLNPAAIYSLTVTYPTSLSEAGFYDTPHYARGVKVYGPFATVADGSSGLRVVNVGSPSATSLAGYYDTPGYAYDVIVSGNYAFVADGNGGMMTLLLCVEPTAPVHLAPANGSTSASDNTPTFDWNATSYTGGYQFQLDDSNDFSSPLISQVITTTEFTPAAPLNNATYYWRVRAYNNVGGCDLYGPYSSAWSVTLAVPPAAFAKVAPADQSIGVYKDSIIEWQATTGATRYQYCLDTTNDNTCSSWTDTGTNNYVTVWGMNYATTYYWQARACNGPICTEANGGTWWSFTTNDQYEPDNTAAQAALVGPGTTLHSIVPLNDVDWIRFTLDQQMAVFLQTSGTGNWDTKLSLYASNGSTLIESNDDWGSGKYSYIDRACEVDPLPAGTYYVKAEPGSATPQIPVYRLTFITWGCKMYIPLVLKDYKPFFEGPFELEENDSFEQANGPLRSGRDYQGYPDDLNDYFSLNTSAAGTITVSLSGHTGTGVQVLLYDQDRILLSVDNTAPYEIVYAGGVGKYYVRIYATGGYNTTTPYTLRVTYP